MNYRIGTLVFLVMFTMAMFEVSAKDASRHVQDGIRFYKNGEFDSAVKEFDDADVAVPEDPTIAFNRACAYAAKKDFEKSIDLFQQAALARDSGMAAESHYNLGCVVADKAKAVFGDKPEEATPAVRQEGLGLLSQAVSHYRDCLRSDDQHENARRNLELLRLWIKHMEDVWAKRDRDQQREEMNLLEFLEMIQAQQQAIRESTRATSKADDSPRRRQAIAQLETAQRQLGDEIEPLKEKITETLKPPPDPNAQQPQPPADTANIDQAIEALHKLADESKKSMDRAAQDLESRTVNDSPEHQANALDSLNEIYMAIAPFTSILGKATTMQERLVNQSGEIVEQKKSESQPDENDSTEDVAEQARNQRRVSRWAGVLPPKAEQELQQLAAAPMTPNPTDPNGDDPQKQQEQLEGLKKSLEKAIELGPKIVELSNDAAVNLKKDDTQNALPKQEESLKLLKEIAESLPKDEQNQNQDQQQQDQQNQQQNENKQDQQQGEPQQPEQQKQMSREQAEAIMRKVRERERQHRDEQKQMQQYTRGRISVDKDW